MLLSNFNQIKNVNLFGHTAQRFYVNTTVTNSPRKIIIIIVGENHTDPAPIGLIRQQIKKNHSFGINQIFCQESPCDLEFKEIIRSIDSWMKQNEYLLKNESIKSLAKTKYNLSYPYLSCEFEDEIIEIFSRQFPHLDKEDADNLRRYIHINETNLILQQTQELKIHYQGIERPLNEHMDLIEQSYENEEIIENFEEIRINAMTENFFDKALPKIANTGGIAWINIGAAHVANLPAAIYNHIAENALHKKYAFQIVPMACFSPYVEHEIERTFDRINLGISHLKNQKLISIAEKMIITPILDITETKKHTYISPTFNELMERVENFFEPHKE